MSVYEIIKKHIDKFDYLGFLKMGAPNDEYDIESQLILETMQINPTEIGLQKTICEVFSTMFNRKFEISDFSEIARNIYIDLKTEDLI